MGLQNDLGDLEHFLGHDQRSISIKEKALGPDHPDLATSLNNLAILYRSQGRYEDTEPLYQRFISIKEKALGRDHPSLATGLENYASLLRETGRDSEAIELEARAKAIRLKRSSGELSSG